MPMAMSEHPKTVKSLVRAPVKDRVGRLVTPDATPETFVEPVGGGVVDGGMVEGGAVDGGVLATRFRNAAVGSFKSETARSAEPELVNWNPYSRESCW